MDAVTDFSITGRLARFGRPGMIEDVSNRLLRDFASCLQARLGEAAGPAAPQPTTTTGEPAASPAAPTPAPPPAAPIKGFSLMASILWGRIRRLFGRGR